MNEIPKEMPETNSEQKFENGILRITGRNVPKEARELHVVDGKINADEVEAMLKKLSDGLFLNSRGQLKLNITKEPDPTNPEDINPN